jgi:hypothetical protein
VGGIRFSAYNARKKGFLTPGRYIAVMALARASMPALPAPAWRPSPIDWRRVLALAALAGVTLAPVALAYLRTPPGRVFTGYVVIARDAFVYQALWRSGWHGALAFHPLFSGEAQPGILIYSWYLWTGHLVGWLSGPWLYHAARLAAGLALLHALWTLVCVIHRRRLVRRWAMLLASLGGGIGVLLGTSARLGPIALRPTEVLVSGSGVADLTAMAPHLAWAAALLCWTFAACLSWARRPSLRLAIVALAAPLGLALIYPQLALLAVLTMTAFAVARRQARALAFAGLSAVAIAPYLGYLAWAEHRYPAAFNGVGATAQVPFHFDVGDPLGFLVLSHLTASGLILAALAARRLKGDLLLPAAWIVLMTAFMFLPGLRTVVGRSYLASSIPFGILAAAGLPPVLRRLPAGPWRRRTLLLTLAVSSLFGAFSLAQPYAIAAFRLDPNAEYELTSEAQLLSWLAPRSRAQDLALTTYLDGVFVPAQTNARVYVGHPDQTIDAGKKALESLAFMTTWDSARRDAFLKSQGIDYVLAPDAAALARLSPDPKLRLVRRAGDQALFQVRD